MIAGLLLRLVLARLLALLRLLVALGLLEVLVQQLGLFFGEVAHLLQHALGGLRLLAIRLVASGVVAQVVEFRLKFGEGLLGIVVRTHLRQLAQLLGELRDVGGALRIVFLGAEARLLLAVFVLRLLVFLDRLLKLAHQLVDLFL